MLQRNEIVMEKIANTDSNESTNWWELFQPHDCFEEQGDRRQGALNGLDNSEATAVPCAGEVKEKE
jgi:hypothetical protein